MGAMGASVEFLAQSKTTAEGKSVVAMLMHVNEATRTKMKGLFKINDGVWRGSKL